MNSWREEAGRLGLGRRGLCPICRLPHRIKRRRGVGAVTDKHHRSIPPPPARRGRRAEPPPHSRAPPLVHWLVAGGSERPRAVGCSHGPDRQAQVATSRASAATAWGRAGAGGHDAGEGECRRGRAPPEGGATRQPCRRAVARRPERLWAPCLLSGGA
ncbi:hypothetical protein D1007_11087 [Hordeum vulgare]|nr:hypothetical protein D1007_11087 [Hordeum vulgare]